MAPRVSSLPNGVAAGDVTATTAVLWTRSLLAGPIWFEWGVEPTFARIHGSTVVDNREPLAAAKMDVGGLSPATTYHYRVRATQGFQSQNSRTLTVNVGQASSATVTITWPSAMVTVIQVAPGDRVHVVEGVGIVP